MEDDSMTTAFNTLLFLSDADADYRGNVGVILFNHADEDFEGAYTLHSLC